MTGGGKNIRETRVYRYIAAASCHKRLLERKLLKPFVHLSTVIPHIESGRSLLTPGLRLARQLTEAWVKEALTKREVIAEPIIQPVDAWLEARWLEAVERGLLPAQRMLSKLEERLLWQQIVEEDHRDFNEFRLLQPSAAAEQARHFETPCSALRLTRFWLLWLGMVTICGSNVSTINLLSEIFTGRDAGSAVVSSLAPVFVMLSSAILRLSGGGIIRLALHRPVPLYLLVAAGATSLAAQLMLVTNSIPLLFVSCVLLGASDGMWWSALPIVSGRSKSALSNREPAREH